MRVQFILDNLANECIGTMLLSAGLKKAGHTTGLSIAGDHFTLKGLVEDVARTEPDVIAASVMTATAETYETICKAVKERLPSTPIVWGGPHPTFMPEQCTELKCVDAIAIGEADSTFVAYVNALPDAAATAGFWVRAKDDWSKNALAPLPANLDALPFPDRDLVYSKSHLLQRFALKRVIASRGCPFRCSYCFQPAMQKVYGTSLVRRRSPDTVIDEINDILSRYRGGRHIHFSDDSFNLSWPWMEELCTKFASRVGLSYSINIVAHLVTPEMADLLKETRCRAVIVGLETANDKLRQQYLGKPTGNCAYTEAAKLMRDRGIWFVTNNMFGLPNETSKDWINTVIFNRQLKSFAVRPSILKAYKGTALGQSLAASGCCETGRFTVRLKQSPNDARAMNSLLWFSWLFLAVPLPIRVCQRIIYSPLAKYFRWLILLSYLTDIRIFRIPVWQAVWYWLLSFKLFWNGMSPSQDDR